jgi:holo-ACP synthase
MVVSRAVTLEEILTARDRRCGKQRELIDRYSVPLISYMVNMPGAVKSVPLIIMVFNEGLDVLKRRLEDSGSELLCEEINYFDTGSEAFVSVDIDEITLKKIAVQIEESHPLGRIFDFDVFGRDGRPLSREMLGFPKRKCLLCNEDAHACGRSKRHSFDELTDHIRVISENYFCRH